MPCRSRHRLRPDLSQRKVLAVGRLSHQKGFDRLIEAWRDAVAANPGWTLEIVGSGELHDELKRQIEENGVADSVVMTSGCSDMPAKYREASILAMTSRYEGLPMALIEGQACGLPIVAMDCKCGPRDVVTDGSTDHHTTGRHRHVCRPAEPTDVRCRPARQNGRGSPSTGQALRSRQDNDPVDGDFQRVGEIRR